MTDAAPSAPWRADAFEALVREHQARVRRQLRRLTRGDAALADDLAQETFVLAWRHVGTFRGDARVSTWLHRIALNAWLAHGRRAAPDAVESPDDDADAAAAVPDPSGRTVQRLDVERALAALPEPERLALIHCFQLDLTHAEAAQVLGWPLGTLKTQVLRARAKLRLQLKDWEPNA